MSLQRSSLARLGLSRSHRCLNSSVAGPRASGHFPAYVCYRSYSNTLSNLDAPEPFHVAVPILCMALEQPCICHTLPPPEPSQHQPASSVSSQPCFSCREKRESTWSVSGHLTSRELGSAFANYLFTFYLYIFSIQSEGFQKDILVSKQHILILSASCFPLSSLPSFSRVLFLITIFLLLSFVYVYVSMYIFEI